MPVSTYFFTSESVSEGHPDKVCDRISDSIVDAFLAADPDSRVAVETLATTNQVVLAGEVRGPGDITKEVMAQCARNAIKAIGYEQEGFHWENAKVDVYVHEQSVDIAQGVDEADDKEIGAGDQGIMFGYATNETDALMPAPIRYSHQILQAMADDRHSGLRAQFGPDAKSQVTLKYVQGKPVGASCVVVSTQHADGLTQGDMRELVRPYVEKTLPEGWMPPEAEFLCESDRPFCHRRAGWGCGPHRA